MIADFLFLLIFAFRIQESCAIPAGKVLTDFYGTSFVFPVPLCENKESIHIVISPRAIQLTTVSIFGKSLARFAELNYGNTKTVSIPCTSEEQPAPFVRIPEGCIQVKSSNEVGVHVLYRQDSYRVTPVDLLAKVYYPTIFRGARMSEPETVHFLSIGAAYNNTTLQIIKSKATQNTVLELKGFDQVVYYTEESSTLTVTSSMPVILLVGSFVNDSKKPTAGLILEQDTPPMHWGRFYVLPLIQPMANVCIGLKAMENAVKVEIETKDGAITQKLLSNDVREEVCLPNMNGYLTVSASRPMLPLFVLNSLDKGKIAILHTVPPIERYLPTPCKISMCYRDSAMIIVAGLKSKRLDMTPYRDFKDHYSTDILNSFLWVHVVNKATLSSFSSVAATVKTPLPPQPLWFFEMNLLKRENQLWIVNSPSAITKNKNDLSCNTSSTSAGDQIDNDCDGLIDEEKANNKDDDNDNLIDEDLENIEAANASIFMCQVYSAPSPSRKISVLHIIFQDGFNPQKEDLRDLVFIISMSTAFIGVIVFIGVCFLLDYLEMKGIIKKHR
ncbi:uncharacterized protein LOC112555455 [Pomacea canaliculata]|uniref:uncharacterized protein LOC112555455 n=1 Tax=Pomacea canaliculata TaxID=400727 RepID=UPI000D7383E3|nr:uncharacterized protein LOC112555455 [Pomacea canaliculata]